MFFLFFVELLFGRWFKDDPITAVPDIARTAGRTFTFRTNGMTGEDVIVNFSRDKYGLRGFENSSNPLAFILGGSTGIEQNVPTDLTWAEVLEDNLKTSNIQLEIVNASVSGHTLFGNAYVVRNWLSKLPLNPSVLIVYYGHNDAVHTLAGRSPNSNYFTKDKASNFLEYFIRNSALAILYRELSGNYISLVTGNRYFYEYWSDYKPASLPSIGSSKPISIPDISKVAVGELYKSSLDSLINAVEEKYSGKLVYLVAQSNPNCRFISSDLYLSINGSRDSVCENLASFHRYVGNIINGLEVSHSKKNKFIYIPLYLSNPFDRRGSSDGTHTNSFGSRGIADSLTPLLIPSLRNWTKLL